MLNIIIFFFTMRNYTKKRATNAKTKTKKQGFKNSRKNLEDSSNYLKNLFNSFHHEK